MPLSGSYLFAVGNQYVRPLSAHAKHGVCRTNKASAQSGRYSIPGPVAASVSAQWRNCHFSNSLSSFPAWRLSLVTAAISSGAGIIHSVRGTWVELPVNRTRHPRVPRGRAGSGAVLCPLSSLLGEMTRRPSVKQTPFIKLIFPRLPHCPQPSDWGTLRINRSHLREIFKN